MVTVIPKQLQESKQNTTTTTVLSLVVGRAQLSLCTDLPYPTEVNVKFTVPLYPSMYLRVCVCVCVHMCMYVYADIFVCTYVRVMYLVVSLSTIVLNSRDRCEKTWHPAFMHLNNMPHNILYPKNRLKKCIGNIIINCTYVKRHENPTDAIHREF